MGLLLHANSHNNTPHTAQPKPKPKPTPNTQHKKLSNPTEEEVLSNPTQLQTKKLQSGPGGI
jgi:hypothetical protein